MREPRSRFFSSPASSLPAYSADLPGAARSSGCRRYPARWRSPSCCWSDRHLLSAERGDLGEKVFRIDGLNNVVLGALADAPDPVRIQFLAGAHDHGDVLGGVVARDGARRGDQAHDGDIHTGEEDGGVEREQI